MSEYQEPIAYEPERPKNSFRLTISLTSSKPRMDQVVLEELRKQNRNLALKNVSRIGFKELFKKKKIRIKGQRAIPSSSLACGITYVDIIGFVEDSEATS